MVSKPWCRQVKYINLGKKLFGNFRRKELTALKNINLKFGYNYK